MSSATSKTNLEHEKSQDRPEDKHAAILAYDDAKVDSSPVTDTITDTITDTTRPRSPNGRNRSLKLVLDSAKSSLSDQASHNQGNIKRKSATDPPQHVERSSASTKPGIGEQITASDGLARVSLGERRLLRLFQIKQEALIAPDIPMAQDIVDKWNENLHDRFVDALCHELQSRQSLGASELLSPASLMMAGKRQSALRPTIVVSCSSVAAKRKLEKIIRSFTWISPHGLDYMVIIDHIRLLTSSASATGLGVGLGVGLPPILIALYTLTLRRRKKKSMEAPMEHDFAVPRMSTTAELQQTQFARLLSQSTAHNQQQTPQALGGLAILFRETGKARAASRTRRKRPLKNFRT